MLAPAAPDKIPHTSPITSFKTELTLSALFTSAIACLLPLTFLAAIAVKCSMLLEATARPIMSVNTAKITNTKITRIAMIIVLLLSANSLNTLKQNERVTDNTNTIIGQIH